MAIELDAKVSGMVKGVSQAEKSLKSLEKTATGASGLLKTAFTALGGAAIGREIIDVTANFQRFAAVLENTLGSSSAAQKALEDIKAFAAATPFSVEQLTSSFVKLANQGFAPTTDELRKLGDLASSTGKEFDQLAEAIIDAQTGEFERLKEFGIRAKKEGDNVKFTFKGVETQTKFTADAIRDYVLSLGDAEGVSGSMAAISQTLGGRISNLGDAWDELMLAIGESTSGPLNAAISSLTQLTKVAANLGAQWELTVASLGIGDLSNLSQEAKDFALDVAKIDGDTLVRDIIEPFNKLSTAQVAMRQTREEFVAAMQAEGASIKEATVLWNIYLERRIKAAEEEHAASAQKTIDAVLAAKQQAEAYANFLKNQGIIEKIELQLKTLEEQKKKAFSTGEITAFNVQIEKLKEELDLLNASRPLSNFGKRIFADAEAGLPSDLNIKLKDVSLETGNIDAFQIPPPDTTAFEASLQKYQDGFAIIQKQYQETGKIAFNENEAMAAGWDVQVQRQQAAAAAATEYGSAVGDALGSAISGQQSFAEAMKKLTADLLKTFLARALGGIISSAATSGGPPPVAIALAAAGVAAISAMFAKIGGPTKSVGGTLPKGATTTSAQKFNQQLGAQQIVLAGEFKLRGKDLVLAVDKERKTQQRTG